MLNLYKNILRARSILRLPNWRALSISSFIVRFIVCLTFSHLCLIFKYNKTDELMVCICTPGSLLLT